MENVGHNADNLIEFASYCLKNGFEQLMKMTSKVDQKSKAHCHLKLEMIVKIMWTSVSGYSL